jgi:hypothetical protein
MMTKEKREHDSKCGTDRPWRISCAGLAVFVVAMLLPACTWGGASEPARVEAVVEDDTLVVRNLTPNEIFVFAIDRGTAALLEIIPIVGKPGTGTPVFGTERIPLDDVLGFEDLSDEERSGREIVVRWTKGSVFADERRASGFDVLTVGVP